MVSFPASLTLSTSSKFSSSWANSLACQQSRVDSCGVKSEWTGVESSWVNLKPSRRFLVLSCAEDSDCVWNCMNNCLGENDYPPQHGTEASKGDSAREEAGVCHSENFID